MSAKHMKDGPLVWQDAADNVASVHRIGDQAAVEAALANAAHVSQFDFDVSKVAACALEMRSSAAYVDENGKNCLITSAQSPYAVRGELAQLWT